MALSATRSSTAPNARRVSLSQVRNVHAPARPMQTWKARLMLCHTVLGWFIRIQSRGCAYNQEGVRTGGLCTYKCAGLLGVGFLLRLVRG